MKCIIETNNRFYIKGRVIRTNIYAEGKAANVVVATKSEGSDNDLFITTKCFQTAAFENLKTGMAVEIYGHIGPANYTDKDGNVKYKDNNDLIADTIEYNESKKTTERREQYKMLYGN